MAGPMCTTLLPISDAMLRLLPDAAVTEYTPNVSYKKMKVLLCDVRYHVLGA